MKIHDLGIVLATPACLLQACAPSAPAMPPPDEIVAEVRARSEALVAYEAAADWDNAILFFAPDVIVQTEAAPQLQGREAMLNMYRTFPAVLEFEGTATEIVPSGSGDMAYEYGINRFVFGSPEGPVEAYGKYLVVWQKIDGEWLVSAIAFSNDAPVPS